MSSSCSTRLGDYKYVRMLVEKRKISRLLARLERNWREMSRWILTK